MVSPWILQDWAGAQTGFAATEGARLVPAFVHRTNIVEFQKFGWDFMGLHTIWQRTNVTNK